MYDVQQLWQLIDAPRAKNASHRGDPRIVTDLEEGTGAFVQVQIRRPLTLRIQTHRAKLEHPEGLPVAADSLLQEKDRSRGRQLDRACRHQKDRRQKDQCKQGEDEVKNTLPEQLAATRCNKAAIETWRDIGMR